MDREPRVESAKEGVPELFGPVSFSSLPQDILAQLLPISVKEGSTLESTFQHAYVIKVEPDHDVYVLEDKQEGRMVFLADYVQGTFAGLTELSCYAPKNPELHGDDAVYTQVRFTFTEEEFERQGLGKQRLILANQYAMNRFAQPLYCDSKGVSSGAKAVWESLVRDGLAEPTHNELRPYRFKK